MSFPADLAEARFRAGLSQAAAADALTRAGVKVAERTLVSWESGANTPAEVKQRAVLEVLRGLAAKPETTHRPAEDVARERGLPPNGYDALDAPASDAPAPPPGLDPEDPDLLFWIVFPGGAYRAVRMAFAGEGAAPGGRMGTGRLSPSPRERART